MELNKIRVQSPIKPKSYGADRGIIYLTQLYGQNHLNYGSFGLKGHQGWDFRTRHIQDAKAWVLAPHDGIIITDKMAYSSTGGYNIRIQSPEFEYNGKILRLESVLLHLTSAKYDKGTEVKRGMLVGISGNTGSFTTGAHLHWHIDLFEKTIHGNWQADRQNGYAGAVDPLEWVRDDNVYQNGDGLFGRRFYYNGKQIQRSEVDALIPKQYL